MPEVLVVLLAVQYPKNGQEQVDDIQIQADRCSNLLLDMVMPHDQLRIHQDIPTEDESTDDAVSQLDGAVVREERRHETEENDDPERSKEIRHPVGEVILGLAREKR